MKIRNVMTRSVTCVSPTDSLKDAYDLMKENEVRHLPVVIESNKLVGILSERDILLHASFDSGQIDVPNVDVETVMTTDVVTCRPRHQLAGVAEVMLERKVDAMPVTDENGELLGIVTSSDFIALAASRYRFDLQEEKQIPFNFTVRRFGDEITADGVSAGLRRTRPSS